MLALTIIYALKNSFTFTVSLELGKPDSKLSIQMGEHVGDFRISWVLSLFSFFSKWHFQMELASQEIACQWPFTTSSAQVEKDNSEDIIHWTLKVFNN